MVRHAPSALVLGRRLARGNAPEEAGVVSVRGRGRVRVRGRGRVRVRVRVRVRASWLDERVRTLGALGVLELLLALVLRPVDAAHLLEVVLADEDHHALGVVDAAAPA